MTYFYPFGILNPTAISASFTSLAVTASFTASTRTIHGTASRAETVVTLVSGSPGPTPSIGNCPGDNPGDQGPPGPTGPQGPNLTECPSGTKLCAYLTPPTGYSIVCIQILPGCTGTTICPEVLP